MEVSHAFLLHDRSEAIECGAVWLIYDIALAHPLTVRRAPRTGSVFAFSPKGKPKAAPPCFGPSAESDAPSARVPEASKTARYAGRMVVAGPANCQCCGKEADVLYVDAQPVAGGLPARNLCEECLDKRRRGERPPCEPDDEA